MGREPGYPLPNRTGLLNRRIESDGGISRYPLTMTLHNSADTIPYSLIFQTNQNNLKILYSLYQSAFWQIPCLAHNSLNSGEHTTSLWMWYSIPKYATFRMLIFRSLYSCLIWRWDLSLLLDPPFSIPLLDPHSGSPTFGSPPFYLCGVLLLDGGGLGFLGRFSWLGDIVRGVHSNLCQGHGV